MARPIGFRCRQATAFVTVNRDGQGNVGELFVAVGRVGSDIVADAKAVERLIPWPLRIPSRVSLRQIVAADIDQGNKS
jgi:hypothetical protein